MSKKILFLYGQKTVEDGRAYPDILIDLLNRETVSGVEYSWLFYEDLVFEFGNPKATIYDIRTGKDISEFDLVYHRNWTGCTELVIACGTYLEKMTVSQVDTEVMMRGSINKLNQLFKLWKEDLPIPYTVFVSKFNIQSWAQENIGKTLKLPFILKSAAGRRGADNYLVNSLDQLDEILSKSNETDFLMQEVIPNDGDYRVFVCGGTAELVIFRKQIEGSHKSNTSLGGKAELVDASNIPKQVLDICVAAAKATQRNVAGVDVIIDKTSPDKYYILEVNRAPQIEKSSFTSQKVTALNQYLLNFISE